MPQYFFILLALKTEVCKYFRLSGRDKKGQGPFYILV